MNHYVIHDEIELILFGKPELFLPNTHFELFVGRLEKHDFIKKWQKYFMIKFERR